MKIANSTLEDCLSGDGEQSFCEGKAIRIANAKAVEVKMGLQVEDIDNYEIMDTGKWNATAGKVEVTDKILDTVVATMETLKDQLKPPVKIGHETNQRWLKDSGYPSAGWMTNVRKIGSKLVADLKAVPSKIAALIRAGAYRQRSVELRSYMDKEGNKHPLALHGLALLGGKLPAIGTLADVEKLYEQGELILFQQTDYKEKGGEKEMDETKIRELFSLKEDAEVEVSLTKIAEDHKELEGIKEKVIKFEQAEKDHKKQIAELKEQTKDKRDLEKEVDGLQSEILGQKCEKVITAALASGRIAPATKDKFAEMYKTSPEKTEDLIASMPEKSFEPKGEDTNQPNKEKLSSDEREMAARFNQSEEDWKKFGKNPKKA